MPTFTERYYSDPANLARADVGPESAWAEEGGADVFLSSGWMVHAAAFRRTDTNVMDWLRPNTTVRWQTYNVRDVDTDGRGAGGVGRCRAAGFVRAEFTGLDVSAPSVTQLSKYALDYAPRHSWPPPCCRGSAASASRRASSIGTAAARVRSPPGSWP